MTEVNIVAEPPHGFRHWLRALAGYVRLQSSDVSQRLTSSSVVEPTSEATPVRVESLFEPTHGEQTKIHPAAQRYCPTPVGLLR